jgi:hypothetical protein
MTLRAAPDWIAMIPIAVRHHVVQIARDPQPFRGHGVSRGLLPHRRGVLPPFPDQYPRHQGDSQR